VTGGSDSVWDCAEGWQTVSCPAGDNLSVAFRAVADATGVPTIGAQFLGGDTGLVSAVTQPGTHWGWAGILDPRAARGYGIPVSQYPIKTAVQQALGWSAAAGLAPDAKLIRAAFTESRACAEDLYAVLLVGLGVPGARLPE
jgi:hypothetical protein